MWGNDMKIFRILPAAAIALTGWVAATPASALTAVSGAPVFDGSPQVSTQFRNGQAGASGAGEIYVAPDGDAGNGAPRAEGQHVWAAETVGFEFSYCLNCFVTI